MSFSNPSDAASGASAEYVNALIERLGGRNPMEVMKDQVPVVRETVAGLSLDDLCVPEAEGKWSVLDVLVHLLDSEVVYGYRMRFIVAQPGHDIAGYDQDKWASSLGYRESPLDLTLDALDSLRRWNLYWLETLGPEERARWGNHSERGQESIDRIVQLLAAHDLVHLDQIRRILRTL